MVDTTTDRLPATMDGLSVPSIPVIDLSLEEGLPREAQVLWTVVTMVGEILEIMTIEPCERLHET